MAELSKREAHRMARRLHLIQVLLNYRTMQGGGYLFTLWPWIRSRENRAAIVRQASGYINSHPVFAALAAGAIRRKLETANSRPDSVPAGFSEWREGLAGPLGATGDALIWDRWKPLVFATGAWLVLLNSSMTSWAVAAAICLVAYNVPLYAFRVWALRRGYESGQQVLDNLRDPRFGAWRRHLTLAGTVMAGGLTGTAVARSAQGDLLRALQFAAAFGVMFFCLKLRMSAAMAVLLAVTAALLMSAFA